LNWGLISGGLVDEIYTFIGNIIIGGSNAPTLVDGQGFKNDFCSLRSFRVRKQKKVYFSGGSYQVK